jgi:hypothetical protein
VRRWCFVTRVIQVTRRAGCLDTVTGVRVGLRGDCPHADADDMKMMGTASRS